MGYVTQLIGSARNYTDQFIQQNIIQQQGGLIVIRPADQWLFGAPDPLLRYLSPASPAVAFFKNDTTEAPGFTEMNTGADDPSQVRPDRNERVRDVPRANAAVRGLRARVLPACVQVFVLTKYNNLTTFPWPNYQQPVGGNLGQQFPPQEFQGNGRLPYSSRLPDVSVWSPNHGRPIVFEDTESVDKFFGVKTHKYAGAALPLGPTARARARLPGENGRAALWPWVTSPPPQDGAGGGHLRAVRRVLAERGL